MKDERNKKVYCTNMDKDDPVIERFLKEYLESKETKEEVPRADDLIVNFDITYADGKCENYTCNNESEIFGDKKEDDYYTIKSVKEEKKQGYYTDNLKEYEDVAGNMENEIGRWSNCVDEWCESCNNKSDEDEIEINEEKPNKCGEGKIVVYSILSINESTTLKGVTINLYKINGVNPELVTSKETNSEGVVVFENIEEGHYRIIQLIDKMYFEKPTYLTWNEVNIDSINKEYVLYVLNTLKNYRKY